MSAFGLHEFSVAQKISMCEYIYIYYIWGGGGIGCGNENGKETRGMIWSVKRKIVMWMMDQALKRSNEDVWWGRGDEKSCLCLKQVFMFGKKKKKKKKMMCESSFRSNPSLPPKLIQYISIHLVSLCVISIFVQSNQFIKLLASFFFLKYFWNFFLQCGWSAQNAIKLMFLSYCFLSFFNFYITLHFILVCVLFYSL